MEVLVSRCVLSVLQAHWQIDKGEDVVLDHDGEAEEDGIQDQDIDAQLHVQPPFVQVDAQDLCTEIQACIHTQMSVILSHASRPLLLQTWVGELQFLP